MILKFSDVAHSTSVSPFLFRWPGPSILSPFLMYLFVSRLCNVFAFPGYYQWCCRSCLSLHLSEMSLAHILERSSVGICLLCVGLVLLLWNSRWYSYYVVFPFRVYGEVYTCLSIVGIRVVDQVAALESCETFFFSSDLTIGYYFRAIRFNH